MLGYWNLIERLQFRALLLKWSSLFGEELPGFLDLQTLIEPNPKGPKDPNMEYVGFLY